MPIQGWCLSLCVTWHGKRPMKQLKMELDQELPVFRDRLLTNILFIIKEWGPLWQLFENRIHAIGLFVVLFFAFTTHSAFSFAQGIPRVFVVNEVAGLTARKSHSLLQPGKASDRRSASPNPTPTLTPLSLLLIFLLQTLTNILVLAVESI